MRYPNLANASILSVDIETYDPELLTHGPGVYRQDGYILGVSIGDGAGFSEYYDLGHPGITQEVKNKNTLFLEDVLKSPVSKVGANLLYDVDWLKNGYGMEVNGKLIDVQIAEALIDENKMRYNLDSLAEEYLGLKKEKSEIQLWCDEKGLKGDPRKHLWRMPYEIVRRYAQVDAELPILIWEIQQTLLEEQGLTDLYDIETGLLPLLLRMRKNGVRLDEAKVVDGARKTKKMADEKAKEIKHMYPQLKNYNSSKQIARAFDDLGIRYPLTEKGNPSVGKKVLGSIDHPLPKALLEWRKIDKILNTFFLGNYVEFNVGGRIHGEFHPAKSDSGGTVSGRFSASHPNLQQQPGKGELGKLCRDVFLPEEDHLWGKPDYSQVEYRLIAHYARGPRSLEVREKYNTDPTTDYHQWVMDLTGLDRTRAKNLNFGAAYSMGVRTCAETFGWSMQESRELLDIYHTEVPFVKATSKHVADVVRFRGHIKTILGRRARLTDQLREWKKEYVFFNRLIQGSAADVMKKAMHDTYKAGIFDVLVPLLTVHDELDVSVPKTKEGVEAYREMQHIMENCVSLRVPLKVDTEIGPSWGSVEEFKWDDLLRSVA